jgi:hypothetical protein
VIEVLRAAEFVDDLEIVLPRLQDAVEKGVLVGRALGATFRRRAVVADEIEDQRVVGVRKLRHRIQHAPHFVVDMRAVAGEYLHHARIDAFWSALSDSQAGRPAGRGVSLAVAGMTLSCF